MTDRALPEGLERFEVQLRNEYPVTVIRLSDLPKLEATFRERVRERLEWLAAKFENEAAARDHLAGLPPAQTVSGLMREFAKELRTELADLDSDTPSEEQSGETDCCGGGETHEPFCDNYQPTEQRSERGWGPINVYEEDGELHVDEPYRLLTAYDGPAEQFWPASKARFQGESAEHWHGAAAFWQAEAEKARVGIEQRYTLGEIKERLENAKAEAARGGPSNAGFYERAANVLRLFETDLARAFPQSEEGEAEIEAAARAALSAAKGERG